MINELKMSGQLPNSGSPKRYFTFVRLAYEQVLLYAAVTRHQSLLQPPPPVRYRVVCAARIPVILLANTSTRDIEKDMACVILGDLTTYRGLTKHEYAGSSRNLRKRLDDSQVKVRWI